ncbi:cache domain-containing protein [Terasakiella sp. A23]|uniref:cache domain-containing protein n=1 Tax=Terasakiella sp. FCG-A23 TaxID=3080561 RepID=UPI0029546A10|nr:cache domain-containing protein [Terasakiella sp. A23]MDV7338686.1 cache domain-containing protein [Terasakiella sp. A23]
MFRLKILLLAVLPLFFAVSTIIFILYFQSEDMIEEQLHRVETNVISAKADELKAYMDMALTAVDHVYKNAKGDDEAAKEQVKAILHDLTYGKDGYFFVYAGDGTGLVHPGQPEIVGLNWWGLQDSKGRMVIKELTERARKGGGYYRYLWEKRSSDVVAEKMSYAVMLEKWDWMIGSGIYLDDIYKQIEARKSEIKDRIRKAFTLIFWIAIFALTSVFLSGLVIHSNERKLADRKLKELTQRIVEFQEEERGRVSRELHDGISQILVSVKYSIELAIDKIHKGSDDAITPMEKGAKGLATAIGEVRRISRDLRPSVLDDIGLSAALDSMSHEFGERTGINVSFRKHPFTKLLGQEIKTTLFRIAQEALTNIERHSGASRVTIELVKRVDGIRMIISDDGVGFDVLRIEGRKNAFQGIGLRNMQERLEFHGGELTVWSSPDKGTVVEARLPNSVLMAE